MNPVIKQNAANGIVDCCGSTSDIQGRYENKSRGLEHSWLLPRRVLFDAFEEAGGGREATSFAEGGTGWELMLLEKPYWWLGGKARQSNGPCRGRRWEREGERGDAREQSRRMRF